MAEIRPKVFAFVGAGGTVTAVGASQGCAAIDTAMALALLRYAATSLRCFIKELLHERREIGIAHPSPTIVQAFWLETKDAIGP